MSVAVSLTLRPLSPAQWSVPHLAQQPELLGLACIGLGAVTRHEQLPLQHVAAPVLGTSDGAGDSFAEAWLSAAACRAGEHQGIRFRADDHVLYGVLELAESDFPAGASGNHSPLQQATETAYRRIFSLLDAEGYPQLWRVWNYLADINVDTDGLERYRQFNIGRQDAFLACGRLAGGSVPAACALGVRHGPLSIAFMAGRRPALPLENPRQISAWDYPKDYGPRSPTFARGALARLSGQELLFVSGTASIVGHCTVHADDVAGQTREAMANIAAVLGEANEATSACAGAVAYRTSGLDYRVYIRHAGDFAVVRETLQTLIGTEAQVVYVQADICRADLLVEIEASASRRRASAE